MARRNLPKVIHVVDVSTSDSPSLELVTDKIARDFPDRQRYIAASEHGVDWERVARASLKPLRLKVLDAFDRADGSTLSPIRLAKDLGESLNNVSYHVKELFKAGVLELVGTEPRRGALEHFYRLVEGE